VEEIWANVIAIIDVTTPLWAALIGAGTAVFAGRQSHKREEERERRKQLATDIALFLKTCSDSFGHKTRKEPLGPYKSAAAVAGARVVLQLGYEDEGIELLIRAMVTSLGKANASAKLSALQGTLQEWYRGRLAGSDAQADCNDRLQRILAKRKSARP